MRSLLVATSLLLASTSFAAPKAAPKKLDLRKQELFLSTLDGKRTKLGPLVGSKLTLVNLWATWCSPCVGEMPALSKLRDKYKARGFEVIGIDIDENPALVQQFLAKHQVSYPVLASTPNKTVATLGNLEALPTSLLLDEEGDVAEVIVGVLEIPDLEKTIEKRLSAKKK
ncbi:MAG: TlpA disulfide reductase family protein [Polyangia bacterium]